MIIKNITLYSITECPKCKILKSKLQDAGIKYEEVVDIKKMRELKIISVPVLQVARERMDFRDAIAWLNKESEQS